MVMMKRLCSKRGVGRAAITPSVCTRTARCTVVDVYTYFGFVEDDDADTTPRVCRGDLYLKTQELWDVLTQINTSEPDPVVYIYGDAFARITHMTRDGKPAIDLLTQDKLKELLASRIRFLQMDARGFPSAAHPPQALITNMLVTATPPPLPRIRRLVTARYCRRRESADFGRLPRCRADLLRPGLPLADRRDRTDRGRRGRSPPVGWKPSCSAIFCSSRRRTARTRLRSYCCSSPAT